MTVKEAFRRTKFSVTNFLWLTIAGIVNAVGVTLLLSPVTLYDSGVSGLSMFIGNLTPAYLPLSLFLIVINFPIFLFGFKKQGASFTVYSLFSIVIYSLVSLVFQSVIPAFVPSFLAEGAGSPIAGDDLFLCAIFGGLLSGVGSGITIRYGGTMDGIETLAVIFAKRLNLTVGNFVLIFNVILYIVIGATYIGLSGGVLNFEIPLYSIVAYVVNGFVVDFISEGLDRAKGALIIPSKDHYEEVAHALSEEFGRGLTVIDGKGYYSRLDKKIIYCVVNRFQVARMHSIISEYDNDAFVTVMDISDVFGTSIKNSRNLDLFHRKRAKEEKEAKLKAAMLAAVNTELSMRGDEPIATEELFMNPAGGTNSADSTETETGTDTASGTDITTDTGTVPADAAGADTGADAGSAADSNADADTDAG